MINRLKMLFRRKQRHDKSGVLVIRRSVDGDEVISFVAAAASDNQHVGHAVGGSMFGSIAGESASNKHQNASEND